MELNFPVTGYDFTTYVPGRGAGWAVSPRGQQWNGRAGMPGGPGAVLSRGVCAVARSARGVERVGEAGEISDEVLDLGW